LREDEDREKERENMCVAEKREIRLNPEDSFYQMWWVYGVGKEVQPGRVKKRLARRGGLVV
jgi:hypothetical protein